MLSAVEQRVDQGLVAKQLLPLPLIEMGRNEGGLAGAALFQELELTITKSSSATAGRNLTSRSSPGGEMRFLAVIDEPLIIERNLGHLAFCDPRSPVQVPPENADWPVNDPIPPTYASLAGVA